MNPFMPEILFGSVLLEANRWTAAKRPTLKISEWADDRQFPARFGHST